MSEIEKKIFVTGSPQFHSGISTSGVMWSVSLALAPAAGWGVYVFGFRALLVLFISIITAVLAESVLYGKRAPEYLKDGSAFLTGLLIGMNMPAAVASLELWYIPVVASLFAIIVVKWTFGGLGANWMNPALAARVFVFFSWPSGMTRWTFPGEGLDGATAATPLGALKTGLLNNPVTALDGPINFLAGEGVPVSYADLFWGNIPGCIGEVSAFLLLIGGLYLLLRKIITWQIPLSYLGSFLLLTWIFGGRRYGLPFFSGDILFHFLSGGLILGVFFMATDMVTSPVTNKGKIIFGLGCGFMTFILRFFGSFPEGVSLAIIFMNIFVPLIDRLIKTKRFGYVKAGEEK